MDFYPSESCYNVVLPLINQLDDYEQPQVCVNLTIETIYLLQNFCSQSAYLEDENKISKPMVWIGIYIAVASIFCILAMGADLLHGFRSRKLWFPCKYFTLNAASITVITVTMKLPVDLSSLMPSYIDQATKLISIGFLCTMMANLMPSLASMDNNTLLANVIGLAILVITIIVNICIQISTGCIQNYNISFRIATLACIYTAMLFWFLIIFLSLAITIPASKEILELKYQAKRTLNGEDSTMSRVEKLRQYVRRYWAMAESGSPQFVTASSLFSFSDGIICVISLFVHIVLVLWLSQSPYPYRSLSDYKWSMIFIATIQTVGVVVGSIAPIFRSFSFLNFKLFKKWNKSNFWIFKVEKFWIQKLCEWKESDLPFLSSGRRSRTFVHNSKNIILSLLIGVQKVIVVSCKMMVLIPVVLVISVMYCSYCWKLFIAIFVTDQPNIASRSDDINEDLSDYVLQLEDEMKLGERTLKHISDSINQLIHKAEKKQHKDLLMLLETSTGFEGVENFDNDQVLPLVSVKHVNSWSLPIITLTCIAIALPNICKDVSDKLFKSVCEGLLYTHLVEESLNNTCEYENTRRATMMSLREVEGKSKWLENTLQKSTFKGKTSIEILKWFADKAEEIVLQIITSSNGELTENNIPKKLILANSMYRITRTILHNNQSNVEPISEEELFALFSSMIADIMCACFTNIPRVIMMKCHGSAIEKREASVGDAAKLFGRTKEIIKRLEDRGFPSMDPDKMAFIDEWNLHLKQSIP